jgi:hypothetical protein
MHFLRRKAILAHPNRDHEAIFLPVVREFPAKLA